MSDKNSKPEQAIPSLVFPDLTRRSIASTELIEEAIECGTMFIGFDRREDGAETTLEGYCFEGRMIITDYFETPSAPATHNKKE